VVGPARAGVVARVGDPERALLRGDRLLEAVIEHPGRGDEREVVPGLPDGARELERSLLDRLRTVPEGDDRGLAAWLVRPRETDPVRDVRDALALGELGDPGVQRLRGLDAGGGLLAGEQD